MMGQEHEEDMNKPEFAHLNNKDRDEDEGPLGGVESKTSCNDFCIDEAKRINPLDYSTYRDECIAARCTPPTEKPEYEFDKSCS